MSNNICALTATDNFPHHWDCIYWDKGHLGCTCENDSSYCSATQCTVTDGSRRFPDGSHVCKEEIKKGHIVLAKHSLSS